MYGRKIDRGGLKRITLSPALPHKWGEG